MNESQTPVACGVRSPRRLARSLALVAGLALAGLLTAAAVAPAARSATPTQPMVLLAKGHGLRLRGTSGVLANGAHARLGVFTEAAAGRNAPLPSRNVFLRGAACRWSGKARSALALTLRLPEALFAGSKLPVYRLRGATWTRLSSPAVVGAGHTTASVTITRPGRYALLLNRQWHEIEQSGYDLVLYTGVIPQTLLRDPRVTVQGGVDDAAVIAAVCRATGSDAAGARSTLRSYDSSTGTPVRVITLRRATTMVRVWSGSSTVGRWFSPYRGGGLPSPASARRIYALSADNLAVNVTLNLVKRRAVLITGRCADMSAVAGFGPWAIGGGAQLFGPKLSTYPPPVYDPAFTTVVSELRFEKAAITQVRW